MNVNIEIMEKHIPLFMQSNAYKALPKGGGMYIVYSDDDLASELFSRLLISKCYDIELEKALSECADITTLPTMQTELTVDDAKQITTNAILRPFELCKRFFIIRHAQTMREPVQNKLLKTFEEPSNSACFILLCTGGGLLDTVTSRAVKVELDIFAPSDVIASCHKAAECDENFAFIAAASNYRVGIIESRLVTSGFSDDFKFMEELIANMNNSHDEPVASKTLQSKVSGRLSLSPLLANQSKPDARANMVSVCDTFVFIFRAARLICAGAPQLSPLNDNCIRKIADMYPLKSYAKVMAIIANARKRSLNNGNIVSIIDELLFSLLEAKAKND